MSVESIIGITSGVITIALFVPIVINLFKGLSLNALLKRLVDPKNSRKKHQWYLRIMNWLLPGQKIKKEYIDSFVLNDRKMEVVFRDICDKNDIEPTKEICGKFLKYDDKQFRAEYFKKRNTSVTKQEEVTPTPSNITTPQDSTVYVSELLMSRYPETCKELIRILEKHSIKYAFLKGTNDIWCRDYMPVKTESGQLIQFKYDPSYLKDTPEHIASRSDVDKIHRLNNITAKKSEINLDGGNVLICGGRAIISKKVFTENPGKSEDEIKSELSELLGCEIIIIPIINTDFTGHADGMVRFVDKNTILGNDLATELGYWRKDMLKVLKEYNLTYIDVPFFEDKAHPKHKDSAIGVYVNYLEVNNLIVVPVFEHEKDKEAVEVIKKAFPDRQIETINYSDVALEGGLLNCTTWVV